jgi:hypothetical protein
MRNKIRSLFLKLAHIVGGKQDALKLLETADPGSDSILHITNSIHLAKFMIGITEVAGMISAAESRLLLYLSMFGDVEGDVIEIGSWLGRSTIFLAKGCQIAYPNSVVHAIDTFEGNPGKEALYRKPLVRNESIFERFKENLVIAGVQDHVLPYRMRSEAARSLLDAKVRLLFIDGCHEYEAVRKDITLWQPLLSTGGYLLLHDYANSSTPGVIEAVQDTMIRDGHYHRFLLVDRLLVAQRRFDKE